MALTKVSSSLVSDNAITTGKLVDGGVHSADIATNAITSTKIAQNSILTKHIDDGQVTTAQLGADAVTAAKIADDAISEEHLDVTVITGLAEVTAATGDLLMVADISDSNNLKKIPVSSIQAGRLALTGGTITGTVVFNSAPTFNTAIAMGSTLNVASSIGIAGTTVIDSSRNLTNIGSIASSGNIVNDIGNSGNDSFIEFKNTGYTGNVTSIRQNADSTRAEFNSTERPIYIQAGSSGSSSSAEVKIYANQQLGLTIDSSKNATFGGDITLGDDLNFSTNGFADISNTGTGAMRFKPTSQTLALTLTGANATFAGTISSGAITSTGTSTFSDITIGSTGDSQALIQMLANSTNGANTIHFGDAASGTASYTGYINYAHDTNQMQFATNGGSVRLVIDSRGNAGIGTTPSTGWVNSTDFKALQIGSGLALWGRGSGDHERLGLTANIYHDGSAYKHIHTGRVTSYEQNDGKHIFKYHASQSAGASVTPTTAMTIDTSGNLLVGTTNTLPANNNVEGIALSAGSYGGRLEASRSGGAPCSFNRVDSDGSIIEFRKAGSPVGNISSEGGDALIIQSGTTSGSGLLFHPSNGQIYPVRNSVKIDNAIDLGRSVNRFKDLYLSGKAITAGADFSGQVQHFAGNVSTYFNAANSRYGQIFMDGSGFNIRGWTSSGEPILYNAAATGASHRFQVAGAEKVRITNDGLTFNGDTAAANALDDYEEGTWTPGFGGATLSTATGHYTKIGNQVTVHYHIVLSGGMPTSSAVVRISGLPFTIDSNGAGSIYARYYTPNDSTLTTILVDGDTFIRLININEQNFDYTVYGELEASHNNSVDIRGTATYKV